MKTEQKIISIMFVAALLAMPIIMADKTAVPNAAHNEKSRNTLDNLEKFQKNNTKEKEDKSENETIPKKDIEKENDQREDDEGHTKHNETERISKIFDKLKIMAEKQINETSVLIQNAKNGLNSSNLTQTRIHIISHAIAQAEKHIEKAKSALDHGKYGKAFGQAIAAKFQAWHALRMLKISEIIHLPRQGIIQGVVFNDNNGNGIMDSDPGLANWTVYIDKNNNGILDNETWTATNANGHYRFDNLPEGNYPIKIVQKNGWVNTTQTATIQVQNNTKTINFGEFQLGKITGLVFNDANNDTLSVNETGLSNWTIVLAGKINSTTSTDASGHYEFNDLQAGKYYLIQSTQQNWTQTTPIGSYEVNITSGMVAVRNFGNFKTV